MLLGAGLRGAGRAHAAAGAAASAGPGRAVVGGVRWGGRGACASGVAESRPCIAGFRSVSVGVRAAAATECVLRHGVKAVRSQAVQLSFRAAPLLRRGGSSTVEGGADRLFRLFAVCVCMGVCV